MHLVYLEMPAPTVFISYSWDSNEHSEWVLNFANDLIKNGIDVVLDQYELGAGKQLTYFMEKGISADKILTILTPNYKIRADKRSGGVGYEYSMLSQEYYDSEPDKSKIIPTLRAGDRETSCPTFMRGIIYHDMREDKDYDTNLYKIIKLILNKPLADKPLLGTLPDFEKTPTPDLDKKILDFQAKEKFHIRKTNILQSHEGTEILHKQFNRITNGISAIVKNYGDNFGIKLHTKADQQGNFAVTSGNYTCWIYKNIELDGTSTRSTIKLLFTEGPMGFDEIHFRGTLPKKEMNTTQYVLDLNESFEPIFKNKRHNEVVKKAEEIATEVIRDTITKEIALREGRFK